MSLPVPTGADVSALVSCSPETTQAIPVTGVSAILRRIKGGLNRLGAIRIQGEIHSVKAYPSGHVYLDLKDDKDEAILHCVIWRRHAQLLTRFPEQGEAVILTGTLDVFEVRGQLQFNVVALEEAGDGALFARFEALKKKLLAEGLFDLAIKKVLPLYPRRVGVVTSTETAALQDVMKTRAGLAPWVPFVVYHAAVQGAGAEAEILAALRQAKEKNEVDVLLLVRGGGSLADLWSFNSEAIARELRRMPMPVVTGVGHETDITIADMAADVRAPTPTGACQMVLRAWSEVPARLTNLTERLTRYMHAQLRQNRIRLTQGSRLTAAFKGGLAHWRSRLPRESELTARYERYIDGLMQRLDRCGMTLASHEKLVRQSALAQLQMAALELKRVRPDVSRKIGEVGRVRESLSRSFAARTVAERAKLDTLETALKALDVSRTLARGFALAVNAKGKAVLNAEDLAVGDEVRLTFARGSAKTRVEDISGPLSKQN